MSLSVSLEIVPLSVESSATFHDSVVKVSDLLKTVSVETEIDWPSARSMSSKLSPGFRPLT